MLGFRYGRYASNPQRKVEFHCAIACLDKKGKEHEECMKKCMEKWGYSEIKWGIY